MRVVKILSRVKIHDKHGTCDALESRISAVAGRTAEFGAEGVGLATRPALLHKSRPLICVAISLLLAEAIRASSGWKILLIGVLSQPQMIEGISHWLYLGWLGSNAVNPQPSASNSGWGLAMLDPSHPIKSHPATASGNAVEEPKPFVPTFVGANDVRAIQDAIDASHNLISDSAFPRAGVSTPATKLSRLRECAILCKTGL